MSEIKEFVFLEQLVPKVEHDRAMSEKDAEIERLKEDNQTFECICGNQSSTPVGIRIKLENAMLIHVISKKDAEIENLKAENKECISRFLHEQRIKRIEEDLKSKDAMIYSLQLRLQSQIENVNFYKNNYDETVRIIFNKNDEIEILKYKLERLREILNEN